MPDIVFYKQTIKAVELVAALAGFANWKKWKDSHWKYFPFYLLALFIIECTGNILANLHLGRANNNLYQFVGLPLEFLFYCWFYYQCFNKKIRSISIYCGVIFLLSWIADCFFISNSNSYFSSFSYCIGNLILVTMVITYIIHLSLSDEILQYKLDPVFWVSIGLLLFYLGTFPYYGLFNLLVHHYQHLHWYYTWAMIFLNYSMYLIIAGVLIWSKPK